MKGNGGKRGQEGWGGRCSPFPRHVQVHKLAGVVLHSEAVLRSHHAGHESGRTRTPSLWPQPDPCPPSSPGHATATGPTAPGPAQLAPTARRAAYLLTGLVRARKGSGAVLRSTIGQEGRVIRKCFRVRLPVSTIPEACL